MSLLSASSLQSLPAPTTRAPKILKKFLQNSIILLWKTRPELYYNFWKRLKHPLCAPKRQNAHPYVTQLHLLSSTGTSLPIPVHALHITSPQQVQQQVSWKHLLGVFKKDGTITRSYSGTVGLAQLLPASRSRLVPQSYTAAPGLLAAVPARTLLPSAVSPPELLNEEMRIRDSGERLSKSRGERRERQAAGGKERA